MAHLPGGTVTFLFTDIAGSTRLWHAFPNDMPAAYARHDAILRGVIAAHGGVVFKTIGDAFQVAFPNAIDAVFAASAAQRALQGEAWPLPEPLDVRMALHTGAVDPDDDGDYRSPVLNRLGRLLDAGHGGQVLASQATMELARDGAQARIAFRDLGEQRLRDLYRAERVYQIEGAGLQSIFPPLRTLDSRPNNLPTQLTQFIGRREDVFSVKSLLCRPEVRLVTLTGPGGMGKTRLALQVAAELLDEFRDGVLLVEMDTLTEATLVPTQIAHALSLKESPTATALEDVQEHLGAREMLLVLDNLEQVIEGARQIGALLVACPGVKVLATSRVRLQLRGEREHPLEPLRLPDGAGSVTPATLTQYESVRLFVERAQEVRPAFTVTNDNAPAVAEICARLDGLPLAIELAAARVRILPPEALLRRLAERLPLLTGGARDLPERQQTLRSAIAWSYELLDAADQALFRRMSVFAGGATLEAIEAVAVDKERGWDAFDGLQRLVDHNLVRSTDVSGEPRFQMYETIREFGTEELASHGEADEAYQRHAEYFASFDALSGDYVTADVVAEVERIDLEQENIRAACAWAVEHDAALAYLLTAGHGFAWYWRGVRREEATWVRRVIALPEPDVSPVNRARFLLGAAHSLLGSRVEETVTAPLLQALREAVAVFRTGGHMLWSRRALTVISIHEHTIGQHEHAIALMQELIDLARSERDDAQLALALNNAGYFAYLQGNLDESMRFLDEGMDIARSVMDTPDIAAVVMQSRGDVLRALGRLEEAEAMFRGSLEHVLSLRRPEDTLYNILGLALVASAAGRKALSVWLTAAQHALRLHHEIPRLEDMVVIMTDVETALEQIRVEIGDEEFRRAWDDGLQSTPEDVLARLSELDRMRAREEEVTA